MEQNLRFGLVLGRLAVLKKMGRKVYYFEGSKAELPLVGILFGTQFTSLGIFISKKVGS